MGLRLDIGVVLVLSEFGVVDAVAGERELLLGRLGAPVAVRKEPRRHCDRDEQVSVELECCRKHARTVRLLNGRAQ